MQSKTEMQQGWDFATSLMGADIAARMGQEYVNAVEDAIRQLEENIGNMFPATNSAQSHTARRDAQL